jgi:hypothetical protein
MAHDGVFPVVIASDTGHERVVAEIYYGDVFVALISQERGVGEFEIEFAGVGLVESLVVRKVGLEGFLRAVEEGKGRLQGGM